MMAKYRKRPVVIEAEQWVGPLDEMPIPPAPSEFLEAKGRRWQLLTLDGWVGPLAPNDWIIKGPAKDEWYPCKPDIFKLTYEPVEETE